jgi:hypothetical protein
MSMERLPGSGNPRQGPEPMDAPARFSCALCHRPAGTIRLDQHEGQLWVHRESFTSTMRSVVSQGVAARLRSALAAADARAVYEIDLELAPFYCPTCSTTYCGEHWLRWDRFDDDGWHDSVRGRCPRGHERMLED